MQNLVLILLGLISSVAVNARAAAGQPLTLSSELTTTIQETCLHGKIIDLRELQVLLRENSNGDYCQTILADEIVNVSEPEEQRGQVLKVSLFGAESVSSEAGKLIDVLEPRGDSVVDIAIPAGRICRLDSGENTTVVVSESRLSPGPSVGGALLEPRRLSLREAIFQFTVAVGSKRLESARYFDGVHTENSFLSSSRIDSRSFRCEKPTQF